MSDPFQDVDALRGHLNRLPSREKIDDLHRMALTLDDSTDTDTLIALADLLQAIRQAHRGGRLNPRGSRFWAET